MASKLFQYIKAKFKLFAGDTDISTLDSPSAGLIQALVGLPTAAGKPVTRFTAIRVASFLSGVNMICNDIAAMPAILFQQDVMKGVTRTRKAFDNSLFSIMKDAPNALMTAYELRWFNVFQLIMSGNFYNQVRRNKLGDIVDISPLNSWCMVRNIDTKGNATYDYNDGVTKRTFQADEIWSCTRMNMDAYKGSALIALAKEALSVMMASDEVAGRFFANGLSAAGFLTAPVEAVIEPDQAQKVVDEVNKDLSGSRNGGKLGFLPMGMKFEKINFTAVEAQLLESRKWNAEEVVRLLGGAPLLTRLGYGPTNATYGASQSQMEAYFNTVLLPFTVNYEQSIQRDVIAKEDRSKLFVKLNADVILRGSPKERAETNEIKIRSGQISPNEARIDEDRDPIDGWDVMGFPANTAVYDPEKGELFIPKQQQPPAPAEPTPAAADAKPVPPAPNKAKARLEGIANSLAERVVRKEEKAGKVEAKFVSEVLNISLEQAETYCKQRENNEITAENAKNALAALVLGE